MRTPCASSPLIRSRRRSSCRTRVPNFGYDLSFGFFYRPTLTQNIVITAGMGFFIPQKGFQDINRENTRQIPGYTNTVNAGKTDSNFNYSGIFAVTLTY